MFNRVLFVLVTAFFVTMNALLWRAEFRGENELGSGVPTDVVLHRILTAPDNSNLEIRRNGKRVGFARWSANIGEDMATGRRLEVDQNQLEGKIDQLSHFTLDCDGEVTVGNPVRHIVQPGEKLDRICLKYGVSSAEALLANPGVNASTMKPGTPLRIPAKRFRFYIGAEFDTNSNWARFTLRVSKRPLSWEIRANADEEIIALGYTGADGNLFEQKITFAELENPEVMFSRMGLPLAGQLLSGALAGMNLERRSADYRELASSVSWQANNDHLQFRGARARVYRLTFNVLEQHKIVVVVSRVGEIFRVTLPFEITLVNDELKL